MAMNDLDMIIDYIDFVTERHQVWQLRQAGAPQPWTDNTILQERKFTNVFRVLDPGSQFVLTDLVDPDLPARDTLMRMFLYRHTGRIETWEYLQLVAGGYPTVDTLDETLEAWQEYRGDTKITQRGQEARNRPGEKRTFQRPVFTSAYLVFPQSDVKGTDKLESIVALTKRLFTPGSPDDVVPDFLAAKTQAKRFEILRRNKGVADFMSMQILTDWGYVGVDREDEFIVAGPGAIRGAKLLYPTKKAGPVMREMHEYISETPGMPVLEMPGGRVRVPSLMDVQNTLCEFSKYARYMKAESTGKPYKPAHPGPQPAPVLPPLW